MWLEFWFYIGALVLVILSFVIFALAELAKCERMRTRAERELWRRGGLLIEKRGERCE